MQRVIAGGVTLTQINNSFLRLDGSNDIVGDIDMAGHLLVGLPVDYPSAGNGDEAISFNQATALVADKITNSAAPTADDHLANKKYVDERDSTKVSRTGDTMTGNLFLSAGTDRNDRTRTMGCKDVGRNQQFNLLLGSTTNKMQCRANNPITLQTTDGFLCKQGENDIIRFGKSSTDPRIELYQNITMNEKNIANLHDPAEAQDAATKNYVDKYLRKCRVGYIPNLEADNSVTGFVASASSNNEGHEAFRAFNNLTPETSWAVFFEECERFCSRETRSRPTDTNTGWLQIKCPEPVIIWRFGLYPASSATVWNFSASNDGSSFTPLLANVPRTGSGLSFFNVSTTTAYQYYRLTFAEPDDGLRTTIFLMQLDIYDT